MAKPAMAENARRGMAANMPNTSSVDQFRIDGGVPAPLAA
jgi:hypothetical protein